MRLFNFFRKKPRQLEKLPIKINWIAADFGEYDNVLSMPIDRYNALQIAEQGLVWNITHSELLTSLKLIATKLNDGKTDEAKIVLYAITEKVELNSIINPAAIIEIISILYVHKKENPAIYSAQWTKDKINMFTKDEALRQFFFIEFMTKYKKLETALMGDFQDYLTSAELMHSQLTRLVKQYITK